MHNHLKPAFPAVARILKAELPLPIFWECRHNPAALADPAIMTEPTDLTMPPSIQSKSEIANHNQHYLKASSDTYTLHSVANFT